MRLQLANTRGLEVSSEGVGLELWGTRAWQGAGCCRPGLVADKGPRLACQLRLQRELAAALLGAGVRGGITLSQELGSPPKLLGSRVPGRLAHQDGDSSVLQLCGVSLAVREGRSGVQPPRELSITSAVLVGCCPFWAWTQEATRITGLPVVRAHPSSCPG